MQNVTDKLTFIAEVGVNHNGSMELAKNLIDAAKISGADIVKFQTFSTDRTVTKKSRMADYQIANLASNDSQYNMLKKLELKNENFEELKRYSALVGIEFLSTGFDLESLSFLATLNPNYWKVPSGEITNLPYLRFISRQKGIVILSTGMSTMEEVQAAYDVICSSKSSSEIFILHCTSDYPAPFKDLNLNVLKVYEEKFGKNIGYSDHSMGIEASIAAIALGSKIIEKHITLDVNMEGPDHKASILPAEFKLMVNMGRNIFQALGVKQKIVSSSELKTREVARKSIVANKIIQIGEIFSEANLTVKRPGTGISPMKWDLLIGQAATKNYELDDLIEVSDLRT